MREATLFTQQVKVPVSLPDPADDESVPDKSWYAQALEADEKLRVPPGLRYPASMSSRRDLPKLKPLNAAYLGLLDGFRVLVTYSAWEKQLYQRLESTELEQVPRNASQFTKAEITYLDYTLRYLTESQAINDEYLESVRGILSVHWLKVALLRHLAEL